MTKTLPTLGRLEELLSLDMTTGVLRWKARDGASVDWNTKHAGMVAGSQRYDDGYVFVYIDGFSFRAHRIVYKMTTGKEPPLLVDHENKKKFDNAPTNLRAADYSQSSANREFKQGPLPRYVHRNGNRFVAQIRKNGKNNYIGIFLTAEEASKAAMDAASNIHGDFFYAKSKPSEPAPNDPLTRP